MCGIVGYIGNDNATEVLLDGLRRLEYRGYDSAGIAVLNGQGAVIRRAEGKLVNLEREVFRNVPRGTVGIGHTRWATHGRPSENNAHPHKVGPVMVSHNGIIENYGKLHKRLCKDKKRRFSSETDTEVIAHLIDHHMNSGKSMYKAFHKALKDLEGSYALGVLNEKEPDLLYFAKNGSPLIVGVTKGACFIASDIPAILPYTRKVMFLEDGDHGFVTRDRVEVFDLSGSPVKRKTKIVSWDTSMAEKEGFRHFMLKEIYEQPTAIIQTLAGRFCEDRKNIELEGVEKILPGGKFPYDKVYCVACGTSYHAVMIGKYLFERLAGIPVFVDQASEFRYRQPVIDDKTLLIVISQSGETADTLAAVQASRSKGAKVLSICNVIDSSIPRASNFTLYTHAGPEIGVASTKAFVTQLIVLVLFVLECANRLGRIGKTFLEEAIDDLIKLPNKIKQAIELDSEVGKLARRYTDVKSFLYFGRGVHYPIALEGALKLKEISYIHAEGYSAGEMKHGPIALIDKGMPVLVLAPKDKVTYDKVLGNIREVKARDAEVIAIATRGDRTIGEMVDHVLYLPRVSWFLQPVIEAVPLQLLAYHVADLKGTDIDQPRNLAKSVTVE